MKKDHLKFLVCPECESNLQLLNSAETDQGRIETGILRCEQCLQEYPILRFIPRFVPMDNYASGFGLEWTLHGKTQYDSHSGIRESEKRFFEETKWGLRPKRAAASWHTAISS